MAINFIRTKYNRSLDSLSAINFLDGPNGTITAYVPFSATSFNDVRSSAEVDEFGKQWCRVLGMQQYGLNEGIFLLKLNLDGYNIYDSFQSQERTAIISGSFGTKNENMSFPFEFKIMQLGCSTGEPLDGDIVLWKLSGSTDTFSKIETAYGWRGNNYGIRIIGSNNIIESKLKVSRCVNLSGFYSGQNLLTGVTFEDCDFSIVTTFSNMFYSCKQLTELDLSGIDFSGAQNIESMFSSCSSITGVTFPNDSLENCTNISSLFMNCVSLVDAGVAGIKTENVTTMANMFLNCGSLVTVDVSNFSTSNCTNMINMFNGCTSLEQIDITGWDVSACANFSGMFNGCGVLTNIIGGIDTICGVKAMTGAKHSIDISGTNLDLPSIVAIFFGIEKVDENSNISIKINRAQLESAMDYLNIPQSKNWKIIVL